ncbi:MAG TPA: hypothetical protein VHD55_03740 [Candidatus Paceibacterota bacterium]|nr:hypothetical protein [Candidatus Paceibacterota bacterium]
MFGKKKRAGKTVAIADIENGSVAAALVRLAPGEAPRLFAEKRVLLPLSRTHNPALLARQTEKALEEALAHISEVSSRMRLHETLGTEGEVAHIAGFFSVPWASIELAGTPTFMPHMRDTLRSAARATLGEQKLSLHPYGAAALHGALSFFPDEGPALICIVSGEATELLLVADNSLKARATLPLGLHTLLRTLISHGGMSPEEARSYLSLEGRGASGHPAPEPLRHAAAHFAEEFADVAKPLLRVAPAQSVFVLAPQLSETWFARALGDNDSLSELFQDGASVRAVRTGHAQPFMGGHGARPDLPLMLEALFVDKSRYA